MSNLVYRFATVSGQNIHWFLKRNCSVTPSQLGWLYASLCVVSLGIGLFFWFQGARLILPFAWLELAADARLPVAEPGPEVLRRTEQRAIVLQLERLMDYPMVRQRVEAGQLSLHGWHYVIEDGEVHVFDVGVGAFVPASRAENAGTGPYQLGDDGSGFDPSGIPLA